MILLSCELRSLPALEKLLPPARQVLRQAPVGSDSADSEAGCRSLVPRERPRAQPGVSWFRHLSLGQSLRPEGCRQAFPSSLPGPCPLTGPGARSPALSLFPQFLGLEGCDSRRAKPSGSPVCSAERPTQGRCVSSPGSWRQTRWSWRAAMTLACTPAPCAPPDQEFLSPSRRLALRSFSIWAPSRWPPAMRCTRTHTQKKVPVRCYESSILKLPYVFCEEQLDLSRHDGRRELKFKGSRKEHPDLFVSLRCHRSNIHAQRRSTAPGGTKSYRRSRHARRFTAVVGRSSRCTLIVNSCTTCTLWPLEARTGKSFSSARDFLELEATDAFRGRVQHYAEVGYIPASGHC